MLVGLLITNCLFFYNCLFLIGGKSVFVLWGLRYSSFFLWCVLGVGFAVLFFLYYEFCFRICFLAFIFLSNLKFMSFYSL